MTLGGRCKKSKGKKYKERGKYTDKYKWTVTV